MKVEANETIPPEWRPAERYITTCARCNAEILKKNAVTLYRTRKGQKMSVLMHLCSRCYYNFLDDYGLGE